MSTRELKLGAYGGIAGGLIFGAMMGVMGMLPMIAPQRRSARPPRGARRLCPKNDV